MGSIFNLIFKKTAGFFQLKHPLIIFLLLIITLKTAAQNKFSNVNFDVVDSFARTVKYQNDLIQLTKDLVNPYSQTILKVRSIFIWITENMQYDYKFVNAGKEIRGPACEGKIDCSEETRNWENAYLKKIIKKKKAVCDGYARLFQKMCTYAGITSEIVPGRVKTKYYQIGNPISVSHAWNAVLIDSNYYFLDATWAAGGCSVSEDGETLLGFTKKYENYYWLTPFSRLVRNHYPENGKWVTEANYTKEKFFDSPFFYSQEVLNKINLVSPNTGMIKVKQGDTIHFKFSYDDIIRQVQINSNIFRNPSTTIVEKVKRKYVLRTDSFALKKQVYIPFTYNNGFYEFDYVVKEKSLYYLDVILDCPKAIRVKVKVED